MLRKENGDVIVARVAALAGRRIDAPSSEVSGFPLENIEIVKRKVEEVLVSQDIKVLISSAACGADLIALEVARERDLRARIILPFDVETFKRTSVMDRPGHWEKSYYDAVGYAQDSSDLIVLGLSPDDSSSFSFANKRLISEASTLAGISQPLAISVWDGVSRGKNDATLEFKELASENGFRLIDVSTL